MAKPRNPEVSRFAPKRPGAGRVEAGAAAVEAKEEEGKQGNKAAEPPPPPRKVRPSAGESEGHREQEQNRGREVQ